LLSLAHQQLRAQGAPPVRQHGHDVRGLRWRRWRLRRQFRLAGRIRVGRRTRLRSASRTHDRARAVRPVSRADLGRHVLRLDRELQVAPLHDRRPDRDQSVAASRASPGTDRSYSSRGHSRDRAPERAPHSGGRMRRMVLRVAAVALSLIFAAAPVSAQKFYLGGGIAYGSYDLSGVTLPSTYKSNIGYYVEAGLRLGGSLALGVEGDYYTKSDQGASI